MRGKKQWIPVGFYPVHLKLYSIPLFSWSLLYQLRYELMMIRKQASYLCRSSLIHFACIGVAPYSLQYDQWRGATPIQANGSNLICKLWRRISAARYFNISNRHRMWTQNRSQKMLKPASKDIENRYRMTKSPIIGSIFEILNNILMKFMQKM